MDQIAAAERVASEAHAGQTDKAGRPYLDHPRRVAARVQATTNNPDAIAAAWLHDVIEDTPVTLDQLGELGSNASVIDAVAALTRRHGEGDAYYRRVADNDVARAVKQADLWDNTDPDRLRLLTPEDADWLHRKYQHALELLARDSGAATVSPGSPAANR